MRALTIVLTKQVVLTEKTSSNIKKGRRTTECQLSSHTILCSVIYPTSFVSTGQPYQYTHNCAKSSKNHPSSLSGPNSLRDILVRADISPRSAYDSQCQKCDSRRSMTCKIIQCTHKFSSTHTGEEFIIYCNANCKTENIIYLLECAICAFTTSEKLNNNLVNA
jgi:hypothetical protein